MQHTYHLTRFSLNKKLGGMPSSITSMSSCPKRCALQGAGCYADIGPLNIHWNKTNETGVDLDTFCERITKLPKHTMWRHNQAGDLPGDNVRLSTTDMKKLVTANGSRKGFTYTHYSPTSKLNAKIIKHANDNGFTVNLSADSLEEADKYLALNIGPVVTLLPVAQLTNLTTPAGNKVVICPAAVSDNDCLQCGLCAVTNRTTIVGFPSHGVRKNHAQKVFWAKTDKLNKIAV